jgi:YgiT-type zinc finger domain-containing protein
MSHHQICDLCGGDLNASTTALQLWHEQELVILRDVPAETCEQCGQSQIPSDIAQQVEQFLENYQQYQPQRYLQVPEFSAADVLRPA